MPQTKPKPINPVTGKPGVPASGNGLIRKTKGNPQVGEQGFTRTGADGKKKYHAGLDILTDSGGTAIYATTDGKVEYKDYKNDTAGVTIKISGTLAGHSVESFYKHLSGLTIMSIYDNIKIGDSVKAGQIIGFSGSTGNAINMPYGQEHMHFEVHVDGAKVDPKSFLENGL